MKPDHERLAIVIGLCRARGWKLTGQGAEEKLEALLTGRITRAFCDPV